MRNKSLKGEITNYSINLFPTLTQLTNKPFGLFSYEKQTHICFPISYFTLHVTGPFPETDETDGFR